MDDTAQNLNVNPTAGGQSSDQDDVQIQPQGTQSQPIGSIQKEAGPVLSGVEQPYIEPAGAEGMPEISAELLEQGVEKSQDYERPHLTEEHKRIGIQHAKESTPVITAPLGSVQLTMSKDEALHVVKTDKKTSHGILWIATMILRHAKMMHQKLLGVNNQNS